MVLLAKKEEEKKEVEKKKRKKWQEAYRRLDQHTQISLNNKQWFTKRNKDANTGDIKKYIY